MRIGKSRYRVVAAALLFGIISSGTAASAAGKAPDALLCANLKMNMTQACGMNPPTLCDMARQQYASAGCQAGSGGGWETMGDALTQQHQANQQRMAAQQEEARRQQAERDAANRAAYEQEMQRRAAEAEQAQQASAARRAAASTTNSGYGSGTGSPGSAAGASQQSGSARFRPAGQCARLGKHPKVDMPVFWNDCGESISVHWYNNDSCSGGCATGEIPAGSYSSYSLTSQVTNPTVAACTGWGLPRSPDGSTWRGGPYICSP